MFKEVLHFFNATEIKANILNKIPGIKAKEKEESEMEIEVTSIDALCNLEVLLSKL